MRAEIATRKAELRTESLITSITGVSVASDVPGLPVSRPFTNDQYWSISGRFRCSVSRSALRLSGVALRPSSARAGSVGSATVAANTITETIARVTHPERDASQDEAADPVERPRVERPGGPRRFGGGPPGVAHANEIVLNALP